MEAFYLEITRIYVYSLQKLLISEPEFECPVCSHMVRGLNNLNSHMDKCLEKSQQKQQPDVTNSESQSITGCESQNITDYESQQIPGMKLYHYLESKIFYD